MIMIIFNSYYCELSSQGEGKWGGGGEMHGNEYQNMIRLSLMLSIYLSQSGTGGKVGEFLIFGGLDPPFCDLRTFFWVFCKFSKVGPPPFWKSRIRLF